MIQSHVIWFDYRTEDLIWKHMIWFGFDLNLSQVSVGLGYLTLLLLNE